MFSRTSPVCCGFIALAVTVSTSCGQAPQQNKELAVAKYSYSADLQTDAATGREVIVLRREGPRPMTARIAPHAGANLFSLTCDGTELLVVPENLDLLPGFGFGIPVLYPMPNRVAQGKFTFEGRTFEFGVNDKDRFLHGLVHSVPWACEPVEADSQGARAVLFVDFSPGNRLYELFPFDHRLSLKVTLDNEGLRYDYQVQSRDGRIIPYGFALHPYFRYLDPRESTYLCVPATGHMQAVELMPTGVVEQLDGSPFDLRQPRPLSEVDLDDVYIGMVPQRPAFIEYRDSGLRITLSASDVFTHMVVYVPPGRPLFCVENQTCSTDAHNFFARGLSEVAHLLLVPPYGAQGGWIRYTVGPLAR